MGSRRGDEDDRVRLRPLTAKEQRVLTTKLRTLSLPARVHRRYQIVAAARGAPSIPAVARRLGCHLTIAYDWVHHFNAHGFRDFERVANPRGRLPSWRPEQLRALVDIALSSPRERGLPFSVWSVPKLAEYCRGRGLFPPFTDEWFRRLLRREGLSAHRVRTWKTSTDPQFDTKKNACGRSTAAARRGRR